MKLKNLSIISGKHIVERSTNPQLGNTHSKIQHLTIGGKKIEGDQAISEGMNNHFCHVGENIAKSLDPSTKHFKDYLRNKIQDSFYLSNVIENDICQIIRKLKAKKSSGTDGISNILIKYCMNELLTPLTRIFNASINQAKYPNSWKIAKVIALYKKKKKDNPANYRPISLLNCFGKILERVVYNQMISFIKKHKILYIKQYAFREKHSTTHALVDVIDSIKKAIDKKNCMIGLFLDIEKAFDCVNHDILLQKLDHYGFRGHCQDFIKSYLSDRIQFTKVNGRESSKMNIQYGVPQGSILGPLFFLLYVNDIQYSTDRDMTLFADDTGIFIVENSVELLLAKAKSTLKEVHEWYKTNKLSVNFGKSNFVIFSSIKKRVPMDIEKIYFNNCEISRVKHTKYIGLEIDELLTWEYHINTEIISSLTKFFGIFYNIRHILNTKLKRTVYFSSIYSKIRYGLEIYGNCASKHFNKIQIIQNKLLRVLTNREPLCNTNQLHKDLRLLKLEDAHQLSLLCFVQKCSKNGPIDAFTDFFQSHDHQHNTRMRSNIKKHQITTELGRSTTHFTAATLWNELPASINKNTTPETFKHNLRDLYLKKY